MASHGEWTRLRFKLLHQASFKDDGDGTRHRSSIAISQGNLFVRTGTKLFCLGK